MAKQKQVAAVKRNAATVGVLDRPARFSQRASFIDGQQNKFFVRVTERADGRFRVHVEHAVKGPKDSVVWSRGLHETFLVKELAMAKFEALSAEARAAGWRERVGGLRNTLTSIPRAK